MQGPVSQKTRNFPGLFWMPQFPLYLRNAEDPSHQTIKSMFKGQTTSGLEFDNWLFGPEKFSGLSRNRLQVRKH